MIGTKIQLYYKCPKTDDFIMLPMEELSQAQYGFGWISFIEGAMWQKGTKRPKVRAKLSQNQRLNDRYRKFYEGMDD